MQKRDNTDILRTWSGHVQRPICVVNRTFFRGQGNPAVSPTCTHGKPPETCGQPATGTGGNPRQPRGKPAGNAPEVRQINANLKNMNINKNFNVLLLIIVWIKTLMI